MISQIWKDTFLLPAVTLCRRELVRFFRQPNRVIGAIGSPLVFWILIGSGVSPVFKMSDSGKGSYLEYFLPGTMTLVILFTAIFSTISIIEDRKEGFLQAVLVAPIMRSSLVLGKILGGSLLALLQGMIFMMLAPTIGIKLSVASIVFMVIVLFIVAFGLTGLGFMMAWRMSSVQGFHAIMNLFLFPLWLLSGAVFPASGTPGWIRGIMAINPLTYSVDLIRRGFYSEKIVSGMTRGGPPLWLSLTVPIGFAILTFCISSLQAKQLKGVH